MRKIATRALLAVPPAPGLDSRPAVKGMASKQSPPYPAERRRAVPRILICLLAAAAGFGATFVSPVDAAISTFPRSKASASVYASLACWRGCQSTCTWGLASCVQAVPQGLCLKETNRCDRYCQIQCRTRGGPFAPDLLEFLLF